MILFCFSLAVHFRPKQNRLSEENGTRLASKPSQMSLVKSFAKVSNL
jgi:hypothetical protein